MNHIIFNSFPGGGEWIIIILVVVLLFGGRKIPELMRGLGQGMREFKKAKDGTDEDVNKTTDKDKPSSAK